MKTTRNIRSLRSQGFTLIELLVVISIIAILAGFALPVFAAAQKRGRLTDSLSNAKQIGTALKMYAGDFGGLYPATDTAGTALTSASLSNAALENLMGKYTTSKKIFENKGSFYTANAAGNPNTAANANQLQPSSNDWGYILGLTEAADARFPLVCTGVPATGIYTSAGTSVAGGVWAGTNAIVVYVDGSAKNEPTVADPPAQTITFVVNNPYGTVATPVNTLVTSANWLAATGNEILVPSP